jgi:UPF0716 family protein affecting phage T7 exclusion
VSLIVRRLPSTLLLATALVGVLFTAVGGASACEKHLDGHQNGSDSSAEAATK